MITIKRISAEDVIDIRHIVLRENLPRETAYFDKDNLSDTFHLGAFIDESRHVGVATFQRENYEGETAYRLRGMAVLPEVRSMGIGAEMLAFAENMLKEMGINLCWCHARIGAINFYAKNGWERVGEEFHVPTVGPHYIMLKYF